MDFHQSCLWWFLNCFCKTLILRKGECLRSHVMTSFIPHGQMCWTTVSELLEHWNFWSNVVMTTYFAEFAEYHLMFTNFSTMLACEKPSESALFLFFFLGHLLAFLPNEKWKTPSNIDLLNPPSSPRGMGTKYGNVCEVKTFEALLYFLICLTKNIHDKNKEAKCCMWLGRCILNA